MQIQFLGGATTVTGSQFLLTTDRAQVLIDCGMFQGSPNESVRNRIPFAYEPGDLDAVLLTHAHLDHCGLLPLLVKDGYKGRIHATAGTIELATLVLLDSGKLHEEFAKREARWEKRHPTRSQRTIARRPTSTRRPSTWPRPASAHIGRAKTRGEHVATTVEPEPPAWPPTRRPSFAPSRRPRHRPRPPLYTAKDASSRSLVRTIHYGTEIEVAPGIHATFEDAGHILGSAIIRLRIQDHEGGDGADHRLLG